MGRDKALVTVEGEPMARRVARALRAAGADDVVCIGGDALALRAIGLEVVPDAQPDEGPLGGVHDALVWSSAPVTVIAPCDLVAPDAASFRALVDALAGAVDANAAVPIVDGRWRALPVALRAAAAPALTAQFDAGERALHRAIACIQFVEVDAGLLTDADEPGDLPR
jgi:molybdopterin-guanine dinucleotide biosynthesis protein A